MRFPFFSRSASIAPGTPFVTFERLGHMGKFGNQLFQVAATLGIARSSGCPALFSPTLRWKAEQQLASRLPRADGRLPRVAELKEPSFDYHPIAIDEPTDLVGYFQSERYFAHCADEVRALFAPAPGIESALRAKYAEVLTRRPCSLHVRRTNYLKNPNFAHLCDGDYFERAIAVFGADTTFLVFSDDIEWCRARFGDGRFVFVQNRWDIEDFFLMSFCSHHVISNSSFSWWAAWLGTNLEKRVIAPRDWFAGEYADASLPFSAGPPHRGFLDTRDLVPPGWSRI